jgi:hypothetical protein
MRKTLPTDDLQIDELFTLLGRLALDAKGAPPAPDQETDRGFAAELKTEHLDDRESSRGDGDPGRRAQDEDRPTQTAGTST